jgi:hypothetical protein
MMVMVEPIDMTPVRLKIFLMNMLKPYLPLFLNPMDADSIVSGLIDRYETGIHFKRLLKDRVILLMKNGDIANYKGKFDIKLSESACIEKLKQSNIHSVRILNFMDFEDIITLGLAETSERMDLLAKMPKMKAKTPVTGPAP